MKVIEYPSIIELQLNAIVNGKDVFYTDTSVSFRIYDKDGKCTEFHVYKNKEK